MCSQQSLARLRAFELLLLLLIQSQAKTVSNQFTRS
jgi:hypothetical protein